jgi:hypothetical protein
MVPRDNPQYPQLRCHPHTCTGLAALRRQRPIEGIAFGQVWHPESVEEMQRFAAVLRVVPDGGV